MADAEVSMPIAEDGTPFEAPVTPAPLTADADGGWDFWIWLSGIFCGVLLPERDSGDKRLPSDKNGKFSSYPSEPAFRMPGFRDAIHCVLIQDGHYKNCK